MAVSAMNIYRDLLPKTNCGECGIATCLAFAAMVASRKSSIGECPYLIRDAVEKHGLLLEEQDGSPRTAVKDMAAEALERVRERAASVTIADLPDRIGGRLIQTGDGEALELPYFTDAVLATGSDMVRRDGAELTVWEQVFLTTHLAHGGTSTPTGRWRNFAEIIEATGDEMSRRKWYINTTTEGVEVPIVNAFTGKQGELEREARRVGGRTMPRTAGSADLELHFQALPRIPVMLLFWDQDLTEGFEAQVKLLFDETVTEYLDIDSILILGQRIRQFLCGGKII